jgi:hypothetical protein
VPFPTIEFGTRISWELRERFSAPGPYTFQLQVGRTGVVAADDWEDLGTPVVDTYYALDDEKRVFGKSQWTHYRVQLTDANGVVYYSQPVNAAGFLSYNAYQTATATIRQWRQRVRSRVNVTAVPIYVLKRRLYGTACTECIDYLQQESNDSHCETCYGTGIIGGYFAPDSCQYLVPEPSNRRLKVDEQLTRGTVDDQVMQGTILADPYVQQNDVIVMANTDDRYRIHTVVDTMLVAGVPIFCKVELRLMPYSDIIYSVAIEEQLT